MDILDNFKASILEIKSLEALDNLKRNFLGRKGILTIEMGKLKDMVAEERSSYSRELNTAKIEILALFNRKLEKLKEEELDRRLKADKIDLSLKGRSLEVGTMHPINMIISEVKDSFQKIGFEIVEGPEIETIFRNFDALNVAKDHPSRDRSDSFYIDNNRLLRTQTTTVQIRSLEKKKLPIVAISYGKVYRPDSDRTHTPMFHQLEGIFLTKDATFANLKAVLHQFINHLFPNVDVRFRPHFFPFTEPSAELDMSCPSCEGKGCTACKKSGWLEMLGCGMVSPEVLKNFGYSLDNVQGFAFGIGVERLAMIKYGLKDIRSLYENDLRFLKQFR